MTCIIQVHVNKRSWTWMLKWSGAGYECIRLRFQVVHIWHNHPFICSKQHHTQLWKKSHLFVPTRQLCIELTSLLNVDSLHYWRRALCRVPVALGKGSFALSKAFAECNTRQRASVESPFGKGCFAECQISGTRQRLCRVPWGHSAKIWRRRRTADAI